MEDKQKFHKASAITDKSDRGEQSFISDYRIEDYERPSVATDIAAFTILSEDSECYRKNPQSKLAILLVKRGEHPFKGMWALPGGFLKKNETVEMCADREITEETGVSPVSMMPIGVFSKPGRDPRGWIISCAFASVISDENIRVKGGTDAEDAKWFEVIFREKDSVNSELIFISDDSEIKCGLCKVGDNFGKPLFEASVNHGIAFDHAEIIATAIGVLKNEADKMDVVFDFLPGKFTLASLQKVQETLMGTTLLTANFRRKISDLVEETDEFTEGAGHRPARLYQRKS